jgi:hypothetical protein
VFHPGLFLSTETGPRRRRDNARSEFNSAFPLLKRFALYQVIKTQAGSETVDLKIACQVCGEPFVTREGQFVLKYFLLREATRLDVRRARQGFLRARPTARRRTASVSSIKK